MQRIDNRKIGEILINDLKISPIYVEECVKRQQFAGNKNKLFGNIAIESRIIDRENILKALCIQFGISYYSAINILKELYYESYKDPFIYKDCFSFNNEDDFMSFCLEHGIYIINYEKDKIIKVGLSNFHEDNMKINFSIKNLKKYFKTVEIIAISDYFFLQIKQRYESPTIEEIKAYIKDLQTNEALGVDILLKMFLVYAISHKISDLHIEPNYNETFRISGRIDGARELLLYIPNVLGTKLLNVIKLSSNMISEIYKKPQDGQLSGESYLKEFSLPIKRGTNAKSPIYDFRDISFRISTYPNPSENSSNSEILISYETMVIRTLNADESLAILDNLNLSKQTYEEITFAIKKSTGIIIVSGPTGSGKTTTLHALLSKTNFLSDKIITFEDPVEIRNMYWTQGERNVSKENIATNFDFLEAKKSILRQDPNIILMGEIRDEETAKFALEAANTGHLVLATLHANSSLLVFDRLLELGVDYTKSMNSVICSFSQRLVQHVCPYCRIEKTINKQSEEIEALRKLEVDVDKLDDEEFKIYEINPLGCEKCNFKGIKGRVIIDETLPINNAVKEVLGNKDTLTIHKRIELTKIGYPTMLDNALKLAKEGKVPFSEIFKVV